MPTSNQQEAKESVSSQLQAISDAYGGAEPCSPAIPEPPSNEDSHSEASTELEGNRKTEGIKRKIETDTTEEDVSFLPSKRSKVNDAKVCGPSVPAGENVETCVKRLRNEAAQLLLKWKESLLEGESFESFCPTRIDALIKDARKLEENLKEQKDALKTRLQHIAHTLEMLS